MNISTRIASGVVVTVLCVSLGSAQTRTAPSRASAYRDPARFVNPFVGTSGNGHTFPGATTPFGMVQPGPDTAEAGWDHSSGYRFEDDKILGFSQTHLSGTGVPDLGDVLLQPYSGAPIRDDYRSTYAKATETASPGYYGVELADFGVHVDLTATEHVAIHRYIFKSIEPKHVLLDLQHGLVFDDVRKRVLACATRIENDTTISGTLQVENWARRTFAFVAVFDKPFSKSEQLHARDGEKAPRFILDFDLKPGARLLAKVSLSTVDVEGAKRNMMAELPGWDFERIRAAARAKWNALLSRLDVTCDAERRSILYTCLYHALLQPNNIADVDGRYRGANGKVSVSPSRRYYSTLSLWDTYRAAHPLYTILVPERVGGFVDSMIRHYQATGYLPIWTLWAQETHTMIGNHAIPVVADAYLKGFRGFDPAKAYEAVKTTSTSDHQGSIWSTYLKYGYYPFDKIDGEAVSRTLEAGVDDYAVARMALKLGRTADAQEFSRRAGFYRNLFDPETRLMRGRDSTGAWRTPFDPLAPTSPLRNPGDYTEANAWQYSWATQHDVEGLVALHGGAKALGDRLDEFFADRTDTPTADERSMHFLGQEGLIGQYSHGNEPSHHIAYLFAYSDRPWRTAEIVRDVVTRFYANAPDGLTGNEDCGQMSAWYVFSVLGFYPANPIDSGYVLGAPQVEDATLRLPSGRRFRVVARGLSSVNKYVSRVWLNGRQLERRTITHNEIVSGGTLVFEMASAPRPNENAGGR